MLGMAASVHQCRSIGFPVHDSRGSKVGMVHLTFISSVVAPLHQQTLSQSERVASWWHSLPRSRSDGSAMGLWRSATAGAVSCRGRGQRIATSNSVFRLSPIVPSGCVSLAGCAHDNRWSSIRTIHLAFTLASAPVVSLLPPYRNFALAFDPNASFQSVVRQLHSDRNNEDEHCRISDDILAQEVCERNRRWSRERQLTIVNMISTCRDSWGVTCIPTVMRQQC